MGDWMTVTITGNIDQADAPAARAFINIGADGEGFHCLCYCGPSVRGLGPWIPTDGGEINATGNLSERSYTTKHIARVLRQLVAIAPSLTLKVHCGGAYESKLCTATVTAWRGKECNAFSWNPSETPGHQRANQHHITLSDTPTTEQ